MKKRAHLKRPTAARTRARPKSAARPKAAPAAAAPAFQIPQLTAGETYAGVLLKEGKPLHHLVLLPGEAKDITWNDAKAWAAKQGGELPGRKEQALLFANAAEQFKPNYYWSGEEYAGLAEYAWGQYFGYGTQGSWHKDFKLLARAVRRVPILPFTDSRRDKMKNDLTAEHLAQEVTLCLPLSAILRLAEAPPSVTELVHGVALERAYGPLPKIGEPYRGGILAGLSVDDEFPVALVLLPGELESGTWQEAKAWAEKQDGVLPSRIDQLVLLKNLKAEFKSECYWSGEEYAGNAEYAWYQDFGDGFQFLWRKDDKVLARAVRRVPI